MLKDCYVYVLLSTEKRKTVGIRMVFIKMSLNITEEGLIIFSQLVLLSFAQLSTLPRYSFIMGFELKLDFKRGKTGSEIKLNNSGRQKKRTNKKQKHTPFRKILSSVP